MKEECRQEVVIFGRLGKEDILSLENMDQSHEISLPAQSQSLEPVIKQCEVDVFELSSLHCNVKIV